jgi:hypothetical protein
MQTHALCYAALSITSHSSSPIMQVVRPDKTEATDEPEWQTKPLRRP